MAVCQPPTSIPSASEGDIPPRAYEEGLGRLPVDCSNHHTREGHGSDKSRNRRADPASGSSNVTPEAAVGGPIGLLEDGDTITIDAETNALTVDVDDSELARRKASWTMEKETPNRGVLAKYARLVSSASLGAVTDGD